MALVVGEWRGIHEPLLSWSSFSSDPELSVYEDSLKLAIGGITAPSFHYFSGVELVGPSKRVFAGIIIEFFWCVGLYLLNIIAFFVRDWNILQIVIVAFAPLLIAYIW